MIDLSIKKQQKSTLMLSYDDTFCTKYVLYGTAKLEFFAG